MNTLLAISPHLDDAIFSAGALLWSRRCRGWRVVVATAFTGSVEQPTGFALACQLDKGLAADIDYMALRREEDRQACAALGAEVRHLPLCEAPHRGYVNAAALFGPILSADHAECEVQTEVATLLANIRPDVVLAPMAIGGHVDHVIVRSAVEAIVEHRRLWLWEDWPYVDRSGTTDRRSARCLPLSADARTAKIQACACYVSQLGFQFGGPDALTGRLHRQEGEWWHRARQRSGRLVIPTADLA